MLWIIFTVMLFIAFGSILVPLYKAKIKIPINIYIVFALIGLIAISTYRFVGDPEAYVTSIEISEIDKSIALLEESLINDQSDIERWKMLAEAYSLNNQYLRSFDTYEKILSLENPNTAVTLADYGETIIKSGDPLLTEKADTFFTKALDIDPSNTKGLFYGGLTASILTRPSEAAERWQRLLDLSPPEEIRDTLNEKINEWLADPTINKLSENDAFVIQINIADKVISHLEGFSDKVLYIIARDPLRPRPPIAVVRKNVMSVTTVIDNSNTMIPGTNLGQYERIEFVSRISLSGDPLDISDNLFDSVIVNTSEKKNISLSIDTY
tara:strand:- start:18148 stop:19122 length:975 start_codon:yes stop_codon:yes gene_type:complete